MRMVEKNEKSVFETLNAVDISGELKKKQNLSYLPWSSAWATVKKIYPDATQRVIKDENNNLYHTDNKTCWVETEVTINNETQSECLAVMDNRNQAIPYDTVTMTQVNKSIKRCLVKNLALFGLGLSLWNGEELSDEAKATKAKKEAEEKKAAKVKAKADAELADENKKIVLLCKEKVEAGIPKEALYAVVKKYTGGSNNPNAIDNLEDSKACYEEISAMNA